MDFRDVDLNLLVALDALLAECNVTRAADRLGLSQSALSASLARLRRLFGDPLLIRAQRGMVPTPRGLALVPPLKAVLSGVQDLVTAPAPFEPARATRLFTLATTDYMQHVLVPHLTTMLQREAPGVRLSIRPPEVATVERQMESGDLDVAILNLTVAPPNLRSRELFHEDFVVVARKDHPGIGRQLGIERFCELEHVLVSPRGGSLSGQTDEALASIGRKRNVRLSVPSFLLVPEIVARSDFIAVLPRRLAQSARREVRLVKPPLPIQGFSMVAVWHERSHRDPANQWLRDRLVQACHPGARKG